MQARQAEGPRRPIPGRDPSSPRAPGIHKPELHGGGRLAAFDQGLAIGTEKDEMLARALAQNYDLPARIEREARSQLEACIRPAPERKARELRAFQQNAAKDD